MTTSFGIQSAVLLHMATRAEPQIPVIWIDTGYLPAETYRYADQLAEHLTLNLHVYQSRMTPARMEALYGRLWEHPDPAALDRYHAIRKVEPLNRALRELGAKAWLAGVRRDQTDHRATFKRIQRHGRYCKYHPLLEWRDADVTAYLDAHDLPRHPLAERGYVTVGDAQLSRPLAVDAGGRADGPAHESDAAVTARATRFGGRKQECGIHVAANHRVPENERPRHSRTFVFQRRPFFDGD